MWKMVKAFVPSLLREPLRVYRRVQHNRKRDAQLKQIAENLPTEQLRHLQVLPSRLELLETLPKHRVVAEVGVAEGLFSRSILNITRPKTLHLIDLWSGTSPWHNNASYEAIQKAFAEEITAGVVILHRGYSWDELRAFGDNYFDWIYIDAGHDYDSVTRDLESCQTKMKPDGIVAGHDYTLWSDCGLVRFGVVEAVNHFCNCHGWEMIYLTNQPNRHLSYAIRRM